MLLATEPTGSLPNVPMSVGHQRGDLCANAMLRAADALSLADGPCSLSCDDFFQELADQAGEISAATKIPAPQAVLRVHPSDENVATVARWPIAALPRNKMKGGCVLASAEDYPMPLPQYGEHPAPTFIADFSMAFSSMATEQEVAKPPSLQPSSTAAAQPPRKKSPSYEHRSLLSRSSWPSPPPDRQAPQPPPAERRTDRSPGGPRANSANRAMPNNWNG